MKFQHFLFPLALAVGMSFTGLASAHGPGDSVKPNFSQPITNIPGKSLIAVEVLYPPGGASLPHTHAKSSFIYAYVVSGRIASKVNDGPERIYKAGESFYEEPGSRHPVSRNASKTQPAKLLAVFVVDSNDTPLTTNE
ncbi:cupin domain-containing protein [Burkholderia cenocepacia]|uniref:cupin domain-containing protein n=1 Tax=Burkholderia cenocepacia TaxID=95486 RepID=UPI0007571529|nr:cupin domain-containing protein [Burkholderia cenocepacia]AOK37805.1 cupin [Burkholderia cenocepacia]KWF51070.1 cupin [Burkholderia cenocepacia]MDF0504650.1 cupin domain-containing protein [Burkholderia cenocepacia]